MLLTAVVSTGQTIVGFDLTRGGSYNLQAQTGVRNAITDVLPGASFSYTSNLTSDLLGNALGVVIILLGSGAAGALGRLGEKRIVCRQDHRLAEAEQGGRYAAAAPLTKCGAPLPGKRPPATECDRWARTLHRR